MPKPGRRCRARYAANAFATRGNGHPSLNRGIEDVLPRRRTARVVDSPVHAFVGSILAASSTGTRPRSLPPRCIIASRPSALLPETRHTCGKQGETVKLPFERHSGQRELGRNVVITGWRGDLTDLRPRDSTWPIRSLARWAVEGGLP